MRLSNNEVGHVKWSFNNPDVRIDLVTAVLMKLLDANRLEPLRTAPLVQP